MGIVNVTPDSFSNSQAGQHPQSAITLARELVEQGADVLDIGGESSRPGAEAVSDEVEWLRIEPVLKEVLGWNIPVSVDTYRLSTMRRALDMGVDIINDIWALRMPDTLKLVAKSQAGVCLMHMHGEPRTMQLAPMQGDVIAQVKQFLSDRWQQALLQGIEPDRIVLDPGIGFGKTVEQNLKLLEHQHQLTGMAPLLIGWSRKSTLGVVTGSEVDQRLVPSVVAALLAVQRGASVVRVHDVAATRSALKIWAAVTPNRDEN